MLCTLWLETLIAGLDRNSQSEQTSTKHTLMQEGSKFHKKNMNILHQANFLKSIKILFVIAN